MPQRLSNLNNNNLFYITDDLQMISEHCFEHTLEWGNDKEYGIWRDDKPYVLLKVNRAWNPFDDAYIFGNRVYIGNNDKLRIVDLDTLACKTVACEMYFGYFYEYEDLLFVATGVNLMCFQRNGRMKWQTETIAVDGVTFDDGICDGKTIEVSCCMDPCPAMWCDKIISVETGEVLHVGEIER